MKLSKKEVEKIAQLARMGLTEEEKKTFADQLSVILDYVEKLKEVDTSKVEPTAQVTGLEDHLRNDEIVDVGEEMKQGLLENAPELEDNLVKSKAVFE